MPVGEGFLGSDTAGHRRRLSGGRPQGPHPQRPARQRNQPAPKQHAPHTHAAALTHLAEKVRSPVLKGHLLHLALPHINPAPPQPITPPMVRELKTALESSMLDVGHPTKASVLSPTVHALLGSKKKTPDAARAAGFEIGAQAKAGAQGKARSYSIQPVNAVGALGSAASNVEGAVAKPAGSVWGFLGQGGVKGGLHEPSTETKVATLGAGIPIGDSLAALKAAGLLFKGGKAASVAEKGGSVAARVLEGTRGGRAVKGAAEAVGERAGATRAGTAAKAAARVSRPLTRPIGKTLGYAGKHPVQGLFGASVGAEVPGAIGAGDPSRLLHGLEGGGTLATILGGAQKAATDVLPGTLGHAASDIIGLPAAIPPSLYLTGKAGIEAATGNTSDAKKLIAGLKQSDPLGALLLAGDPKLALKNLQEHPVYGALEALGIKSALGHVGGRAAAAGALGKDTRDLVTTRRRPPIHFHGRVHEERGPYSKDLIQAKIQARRDVKALRKRPGPHIESVWGPDKKVASIRGTEHQYRRYVLGAPVVGGGLIDRLAYIGDATRRGETQKFAEDLVNASRGPGRSLRRRGKIDQPSADVASLSVQPIVRTEHLVDDLKGFRQHVEDTIQHLEKPSQVAGARNMIALIDEAIKNPRPEIVRQIADTFITHQTPVVNELEKLGLLSPEARYRAVGVPFARAHMGADFGHSTDVANQIRVLEKQRVDEGGPGLTAEERGQLTSLRAGRDHIVPDGRGGWRYVSPEEVHAAMAAHGFKQSGFLTHRMGAPKGMRASYKVAAERPRMSSARRTGAATSFHDPSFEALLGQGESNLALVHAARTYDGTLNEISTKVPGEPSKSMANANHFLQHPEDFPGAHQLENIPGGWIAVRQSPWPDVGREIKGAQEAQNPDVAQQVMLADEPQAVSDSVMETAIRKARESSPTGKDGNIVFVPKVEWTRFQGHFARMSEGWKAMQATAGIFKGAVLPTSPAWLTGNIVDNYVVRLFGTGLGPMGIRSGRGYSDLVVRELGPKAGARFSEGTTPGGLYGTQKRVQPFRGADSFVEGRLANFARAGHAFLQNPTIATLHGALKEYQRTIFNFDHKFVETYPQYAELSRTARRDLNMTRRQFRKAVGSQDQAVLDLAKGQRNTHEQIRYAKRVEATFGNWGKMSPGARKYLSSMAPFWTWARAATKFVFTTLPRDHPIITGIMAAAANMTRTERYNLGLDLNAINPLPGFLQAGIPGPGGSTLKLSNLTSYGFFADPTQSFGQVPAPEFSAGVEGLLGVDWKGDKLVDSNGQPASQLDKIKYAVTQVAGGFVPFLNPARQVATHGISGLSPIRSYDKGLTDYLRQPRQTIQVPVSGSSTSGSSGGVWGSQGSSGGTTTPNSVWGSGSSSAPSGSVWGK